MPSPPRPSPSRPTAPATRLLKVAAYDFGIKTNILRRLAAHGCQVRVFPATAPGVRPARLGPRRHLPQQRSRRPGGRRLRHRQRARRWSRPARRSSASASATRCWRSALGAKTYKLKFGHRGANHPVKFLDSGAIEITSQNHGFAVDPDSLPADVEVTHLNLYDGTVEGLRHTSQAGLLRAVPPGGVARPARRRLPVQAVRRPDGIALKALRPMPRRTDLKRILVIGSGPIVIGQACEFDYSGTQAMQGAARGGPRGRARQQQSGHDHDRPGAGRPHLHRAAHRRRGRTHHRAREARRDPADGRRADRAQPGHRAARSRRARAVRRASSSAPRSPRSRWPRTGSCSTTR